MKIKTDHSVLIKNYFDGTLDESQQAELQGVLEESTEAKEEFETMRLAVASIKANGLRRMLEEFQREHYPEDAAAGERARVRRESSREDTNPADAVKSE